MKTLLAGRRMAEPPEIAIIKDFVQSKFNHSPEVGISEKQIIITVQGAGLAGALRPFLSQLQESCNTSKRLIIRIK